MCPDTDDLSDNNELSMTEIAKMNSTMDVEKRNHLQFEGRRKFHKQKRLVQYIYPLIMIMIVINTIIVPLIIKTITASTIMSKIALLTSMILIIKLIFWADKSHQDKTKVEILQVPPNKHNGWIDRDVTNGKYIPMINNGYYDETFDTPEFLDKSFP